MVYACRSFSSKEQVSFNFVAAVIVHSDFGVWENKICHCFHLYPMKYIFHEVMKPDAMILVFWVLSFKAAFSFSSFNQKALQFLYAFCHKGGVICISEVIDISPSNLDSSLCFTQPGISQDVTVYSLGVLLPQFGTSPLFNVRF